MFPAENKLLYSLLINNEFVNTVVEADELLSQELISSIQSYPDEFRQTANLARKIICGNEISHPLSSGEAAEIKSKIFEKLVNI